MMGWMHNAKRDKMRKSETLFLGCRRIAATVIGLPNDPGAYMNEGSCISELVTFEEIDDCIAEDLGAISELACRVIGLEMCPTPAPCDQFGSWVAQIHARLEIEGIPVAEAIEKLERFVKGGGYHASFGHGHADYDETCPRPGCAGEGIIARLPVLAVPTLLRCDVGILEE